MDRKAVFAIAIALSVATVSACYGSMSSFGDNVQPRDRPLPAPPGGPAVSANNSSEGAGPADTPDEYIRNYSWSYKGTEWTARLAIPKACYRFYKGRSHNLTENYAGYALSDYDRGYLKSLIDGIRAAGAEKNYTETDDVMSVLAFIQSLPYMTDKASTGYDEYPRYPIETLVDGGGDCEDTAILAAAILDDMGYGAVLIRLPGHMALGVECNSDYPGSYYEYDGGRYYYLDTTDRDLGLGQMPDQYKGANATIWPLVRRAGMYENFSFRVVSLDGSCAYLRVHCNVSNAGTGTAKNATLYFAALAPDHGAGQAWPPDIYVRLGDVAESGSGWVEATLRVPRDQAAQVESVLYGDNFPPVVVDSDVFYV